MAETVRVRFAPSPTGAPHVGNIRTALFNWLFARQTGGTFILRVEDTDQARLVPGAVEAIEDSLSWLGLQWDEGPDVGGPHAPYVQSERLSIYQDTARQLVAAGHAYCCFCSSERLEEMRLEQQRRKEPPRYDQRCRTLDPAAVERELSAGTPGVVRFAIPPTGQTAIYDVLRGEVVFENALLDDFVLLKSDGFPTYHLANIVDDHLMAISHVLRGEEWISSTPRHVLLYRALGWEPPVFVHLPIILGPDRSKLSKRHGATTVQAYREEGYLSEALFNFLALLGWSMEDEREVFTRAEAVRAFSLERLGKTPSIFNIEKLDWMNGVYIRQLDADELAVRLGPFLDRDLPAEALRPVPLDYVRRIAPLVQERIKKLSDVTELTGFLFVEELEYPSADLVPKGLTVVQAREALAAARDRLAEASEFRREPLDAAGRALAAELGLKTGQLFAILRVAITGRTVAPPLFETMEVLGPERTLDRIDRALERLEPSGEQ